MAFIGAVAAGYETLKSRDLPAFEHSAKGEGVTKIKQVQTRWEAGSKVWSFFDNVIIECHQCNFSRENFNVIKIYSCGNCGCIWTMIFWIFD